VARQRADTLLAERGLVSSRSDAAARIRAGAVRLGPDGRRLTKPGELVPDNSPLVVEAPRAHVSRGGTKLENALAALPVETENRRAIDVGASTGGFTDCLLQHGAAHVIAVDVGHGQLDWSLRNDDRVTVMERTNARELEPAMLPYAPDLAVVDVSFISVSKLIRPLAACTAKDADILLLVKPQFELGRGRVRGGVVRDPAERREAIEAVAGAVIAAGLSVRGLASSGLPGPKGNRETFLWASRGGPGIEDLGRAIAEVEA
jgi:23S rRNA (cytidine1920-2'-O)/16S rRNA (cytidine1409-2'-O)-methyltransferase